MQCARLVLALLAVAVVVETVVQVRRGVSGEHVGSTVVAVALLFGKPVAVVVVGAGRDAAARDLVTSLVDEPVAVVVHPIWYVVQAGSDGGVQIVTVPVFGGDAIAVLIRRGGRARGHVVHEPVAVVVRAVLDLGCSGPGGRVVVVAVPGLDGEAVAVPIVLGQPVVDGAVAIVVSVIRKFRCARVDRRVRVVAVG